MSADLLIYRLWRLRRLIAVAILPPLAVTALALPANSPFFATAILISVAIPLAHVLIYPKDWAETMTVSIVLAAVLWLASGIEPGLGPIALGLRAMGLAALAVVLFIVLILPVGMILSLGPMREQSQVSASRRSRLAPAELKDAITLYPGRADIRTTCGPADADGIFSVETRHEFEQVEHPCEPAEADGDADGHFDEDGNMRVRYFAAVRSSGDDHHEVISFEEPGGPVEASRYDFEVLPQGTRVTLEETTAGLTVGMALGFWLQDYLADYLTDEIDRAEGRAPRANRAFSQSSLLVDLVNWLGRRLRRDGGPQPDET